MQNTMWYVYLIKCKDNELYTGCTNDLKDRMERHKNGHVPATKERRPLELTNYIAFKDKYKAFEFEKYLKSGSGRAFLNKHFI
jgi:predicted GIY-YIG superfamily endonuclease